MGEIAFIENDVRMEQHKTGVYVPVYRVHSYPLSMKDKKEIRKRKEELIKKDYVNKYAL